MLMLESSYVLNDNTGYMKTYRSYLDRISRYHTSHDRHLTKLKNAMIGKWNDDPNTLSEDYDIMIDNMRPINIISIPLDRDGNIIDLLTISSDVYEVMEETNGTKLTKDVELNAGKLTINYNDCVMYKDHTNWYVGTYVSPT